MNKLFLFSTLLLLLISFTSCNLPVKLNSEQRTPEQIKQSIVKIRANNTGREGSGFVVGVSNREAYIITVSHVVTEEPNPTVEFLGNKKFKAEVLHSEAWENGLALLLVRGNIPYGAIPLYLPEEHNLKLGDKLYTIGFPRGGAHWSYDDLSYSGLEGRKLQFSGSNLKEGNSGSPIIKGEEVVAIVTSVIGYAFAISSKSIREYLRGMTGSSRQIIENIEKWAPSNWNQTQQVRLSAISTTAVKEQPVRVFDNKQPSGTILAFSTEPGAEAFAIYNQGIYTKYLLEAMQIPALEIEDMLKHVHEAVKKASKTILDAKQIPWYNSAYTGTFCFSGCLPANFPKHALVVGNSGDGEDGVIEDARKMANALTQQGFNVTVDLNLKNNQMKQVINKFVRRLQTSEGVGLFYFSGYGATSTEGKGFIFPYDHRHVTEEFIFVESILSKMQNANKEGLNIIILDSSRAKVSLPTK